MSAPHPLDSVHIILSDGPSPDAAIDWAKVKVIQVQGRDLSFRPAVPFVHRQRKARGK